MGSLGARVARKRALRRNTTFNRTNVSLGQGFPLKMLVTHKYVQSGTLTSTSGVQNNQLFKANGLHDPDTSGSGHQPMYYDQLLALYDHWTVIGSKIVCQILPSETNTVPIRCCLLINDDATVTPTNFDNLCELYKTRKIIFNTNTSSNPYTLSMKWSGRKAFGKFDLNSSLFRGEASTDPTEQQNFQLTAQSDGATTGSIKYTVTVTYIAVWTELKDIASS